MEKLRAQSLIDIYTKHVEKISNVFIVNVLFHTIR